MSDELVTREPNAMDQMDQMDIGAYCRAVETHLTQVNGGHLVRIVGPGFEIVRKWAADGVPLSVVFRGIDTKAARHRVGAARRPLRIEFCDEDVREVFDDWRRAIGVAPTAREEAISAVADDQVGGELASARRTATRDLDRAIERLSRATGRLDWPEALREALGARLEALTTIRADLRSARGEARAALLAQAAEGDRAFAGALRAAAPPAAVAAARADAERELSSYRARLSPAAWSQAVDVTADRLLRDHLGLPT
jgi:hypothetical protein